MQEIGNSTDDRRPTLETPRLLLRPFCLDDAKDVQRLAGHHLIAATTANVPHPYEDGMAEAWIQKHPELFARGEVVAFAIDLKSTKQLVGCVTIFDISKLNQKGEIGYWIGVDHWKNGYCSEAAKAVLRFGFEKLNLHRIVAKHIDVNPASGRVMKKIGMKYEGTLREDRFKNGRFANVELFGILRNEFIVD